MSTLMTLKGMGAATSSAVLAAADPSIPFLSDVMLMVCLSHFSAGLCKLLNGFIVNGLASRPLPCCLN